MSDDLSRALNMALHYAYAIRQTLLEDKSEFVSSMIEASDRSYAVSMSYMGSLLLSDIESEIDTLDALSSYLSLPLETCFQKKFLSFFREDFSTSSDRVYMVRERALAELTADITILKNKIQSL